MLPLNKPEYPLKEQLPEITDHNNLPEGAVELARVENVPNGPKLLIFVKNQEHLSILDVRASPKYRCHQVDYPLEFLSWVPFALDDFRKPPGENTIPGSLMATVDVNVGGEMLCIHRCMGSGGYAIVNNSRCIRNPIRKGDFEPQEIDLPEYALYHKGLIDLIKKLAIEQGLS